MNDTQITQIYNEMVEHYGDKLPNFEHEPIRFKAFLTHYLYHKEQLARFNIMNGDLQ